MNLHKKMTAVAKINPYHSVDTIVNRVENEDDSVRLIGVKNVKQMFS